MWSRVRGLIGWSLPPGRALVIEPAKQIHTLFMSQPIDVIFCTREWEVVHVIHRMAPWKVSRWVSGARYVIELPGGSGAPVNVGDQLV